MGKYPSPVPYRIKNKDKYRGKNPVVISRSSWETRFFLWCEKHTQVEWWVSEEVVIRYIDPVDGKTRRYFPDCLVHTTNGETMLVELKPKCQTVRPKERRRNGQLTKTYMNALKVYLVNMAKFEAARAYCNKKNYKFVILNEENIPKI